MGTKCCEELGKQAVEAGPAVKEGEDTAPDLPASTFGPALPTALTVCLGGQDRGF